MKFSLTKFQRTRFKSLLFTLSLAALGMFLLLYTFNENLVFFYTPSELTAEICASKKEIRLGGLVLEDSYNRLLAKPVSASKMVGDLGAQDRSVFDIHEDPSTKSTQQIAAENELCKQSNKDMQNIHTFLVTDKKATQLVKYQGMLPNLFKEGQGVIAIGKFQEGCFIASEILAKHDENYIPKEVYEKIRESSK